MPVATDLPRPEYPRPDRQRGFTEGFDWLNLNGAWQFRFDGDRRGLDERWFEPPGADASTEWPEQIIVPFPWESLAAWGEGDAAGNDHYYATRVFRDPLSVTRENHRSAARFEVGWYRREVRIPRASGPWLGKRIILTVGAADFFTDLWCNGVHLGRHEGGYTPFEFDLTDALGGAEFLARAVEDFVTAHLVLRVEDPMDNAEQPVGKQWRWYTTTSGIWQTVFIEPRHATHLAPFRIIPDINAGVAEFLLPCVGTRPGDVVEVEIQPPLADAQAYQSVLVIDAGSGVASGSIAAQPLVLWDHAEPWLYYVRLRLRRGEEALDEVQTYFGMRELATYAPESVADQTAPAALCLNGQPVYLRGALHQSFYPDGVYTAGDARMLRDDIAAAKKAGFDFLRIHIKIDDPLLLYYADTLGMLLMLDFPNFGEGGDTATGRRRYEEMMLIAMERDFNHPSVIAWCLFNETWGFGGQVELVKLFGERPPDDEASAEAAAARKLANQSSLAWVQKMWELAKSFDPTRLVEDMSVVYWEHLDYYAHGDTDINSWHFYINDYARAREHIEKVVNATYAGSLFNYAQGYAQKQQPLITSEYGGIGALDGDRDISWSFKFLTNELRRQPKLSAYVFTQLHDVEWEYNGFLNYDRTPKDFGYDPAIINHGDVLPVDAPPIQRCAPGETVRIAVSSSHYGRRPSENVFLRWRLSGIDALGRRHDDLAQDGCPIPFPPHQVAPAADLELTMPDGPFLPMLCRLALVAHTADGVDVAQNYVEFFVARGTYPPAREDVAGLTILRAAPADWAQSGWSERLPNRAAAGADDSASGARAGFFEWSLPLGADELAGARRLRVLAEASSCRMDSPQTDVHAYPTTLQIALNDVPVYHATLPNHPHDARGSLSYLRGGRGAYGYLARATAEGELLRRIVENAGGGTQLRLRCAVPMDSLTPGGLVLYGPECGRYPFGLTVIVER